MEMKKQFNPTYVAEQDPNVVVPRHVREAAARADSIQKEIYFPDEPEGEKPEGEVTPPGNEPEKPVVEPPAPLAPPAPPANDPPPDWEHQFKSLKGRFDQQSNRVRTLEGMLDQLQAQIATQQAPTTSVPPANRLITPEEEADYGSDLLDVVARRARESVAPELQRIQSLLEANVTQTKMSKQEAMLNKLDTEIPTWREINVDQNFLAWLALPDAFSGATRLDLLQAAYTQNDGSRVGAFFKGFLAEEAATAPQTQVPPARAATVDLKDLAAPGRAKSAAARAPVEKPIITRQEITNFYAEVAQGKYRGKEAEKDALEAQLFEAERDGRIK